MASNAWPRLGNLWTFFGVDTVDGNRECTNLCGGFIMYIYIYACIDIMYIFSLYFNLR